MQERYLPESDTFTDIQLDEIDNEQPTFDIFYELIHKTTCIHRYIAGASLKPLQKKELYCMAVSWINNNLKEKDTKEIAGILPLGITTIAQLDDATIEQLFPLLKKILAKHSIIWSLLDSTALLLEEEAKKLVTYAQPHGQIQTHLYRARDHFRASAKKFIKNLIEDPLEPNKRAWIDTYVRTIEKHFDYWSKKSSIPLKKDCELNFFIDLTHLNLQGLNLSNIPLKNANLSHSRLAGSQFSRTKVSAVQLYVAKEFTRIVDIQPELRLEAQNKYFQLWQQRLKKRMEQFDEVNAKISASQLE
ncbi:MAG: pentapeptide repeat-containing protein, partial [Gammaproteobacteria bacterium]|nr:pentapeptide repeat-containing protein [Gammaproteobacteria bacterium]